jgi:hypothetical protein
MLQPRLQCGARFLCGFLAAWQLRSSARTLHDVAASALWLLLLPQVAILIFMRLPRLILALASFPPHDFAYLKLSLPTAAD